MLRTNSNVTIIAGLIYLLHDRQRTHFMLLVNAGIFSNDDKEDVHYRLTDCKQSYFSHLYAILSFDTIRSCFRVA